MKQSRCSFHSINRTHCNLFIFLLVGIASFESCNTAGKQRLTELEIEQERKMYSDTLFTELKNEFMDQEHIWYADLQAKFDIPWSYLAIINDSILRVQVVNTRNEISDIANSIRSFYSKNRMANDTINGYVNYTKTSLREFNDSIKGLKREIRKHQKQEDIKVYCQSVIKEVQDKKNALISLKLEFLIEPINSAIIIGSFKGETLEQRQINDSIINTFFRLRDNKARFYFKESYLELFSRYKKQRLDSDKNKINALKFLYPMCIIYRPEILDIDYYKFNTVPQPSCLERY